MESNRAQLYLSFQPWAGRTDEEGVERVLSTSYGSLLPVASSCEGLIFRVSLSNFLYYLNFLAFLHLAQ